MIPGSQHCLLFTRASLYSLIHLGQRLNLISALNCFVEVSYGMGVRAAGYTQAYRQLLLCSPTKQDTRFTWHVYLQILGLCSGKEKCLYCDYDLYEAQELVCKIRKCKSKYLFDSIWRIPINVNPMKSTISLMFK